MTVYIDKDFRCHTQPGDGLSAVNHTFFDGKEQTVIETYRYIPTGYAWKREDGQVFYGEMFAPYKNGSAEPDSGENYEDLVKNASEYVAAYEEGVASAWA